MSDNISKVYFPGLNGLRFFAASAVIITHVELLKISFGFKSYWSNPLFFELGSLGVYFFFVLSGFLITYLLLKEKDKTGQIGIKKFYIRRILRIWPLYYFVLIVGFFILPFFPSIQIHYLQGDFDKHFILNLVCYLFILPNLAFSFFLAVPHIGQSWSIGVEEQFYLFWPLIINKSKKLSRSLILFVVFFILIKIIVLCFPDSLKRLDWYLGLKRFIAMSKFESMAIGGLGAYFLYTNNIKILKIITNKYLVWGACLMLPLLIFFTPNVIQDGIYLFYSFLFLVIIISVATQKSIFNFENRFFSFLGNISYGIYMYHMMIIAIVLSLFREKIILRNEMFLNMGIYVSVFCLTIITSIFSYYFFEKKFIDLKSRFTIIKSGNAQDK